MDFGRSNGEIEANGQLLFLALVQDPFAIQSHIGTYARLYVHMHTATHSYTDTVADCKKKIYQSMK